MLEPFGGVRPWVHPVLAGGVLFLMCVVPTPGRVITGVAALLLFTASLAALALTHRLIDAINPVALWRVHFPEYSMIACDRRFSFSGDPTMVPAGGFRYVSILR